MKYTLTIIVLSVVQLLYSAPYAGTEFEIKQPDGSYVTVKIFGDEFYQRAETLDGYTLVKDPNNSWMCYAELSGDGQSFKSTGKRYIANQKRSISKSLKKHLKLSKKARKQKILKGKKLLQKPKSISAISSDVGSLTSSNEIQLLAEPLINTQILGLTLLIDFPDEPATVDKSKIVDFVNLIGYSAYGNNGSVYDYFYDISDGNLEYTNYVIDYYTATNDKSYYTDPDPNLGVRARELILDALRALDDNGFDFSTLSTNSSDQILAINAFYAGGVAIGEGLWPHKSSVSGFSADGVSSWDYQISNIGTELKLRTFCHENGHMICGFPDLYDYDYDSRGVGDFCLMAYGGSNYNPVPPCGALRYTKGWGIEKEMLQNCELTSNSNEMYKYTNPYYSKEYFIIEAIENTGRRTSCPDEGLAIWHVDENASNDNQQMGEVLHYLVSLEQADGDFDLENYSNTGDSIDLFDDSYNTFNDESLPNAHWWNDNNSLLDISGTSSVGPIMTFTNNTAIFDFEAFALLSKYWENADCTYGSSCGVADFYTDGDIDINDLMIFANNWLNKWTYIINGLEDDFETGDFSEMPWTHSGNASWTVISNQTYQGSYAIRSGEIDNSQQSYISITVNTEGFNKIGFARKVSSEKYYDFLEFYIDEEEAVDRWSGNVRWSFVEYDLPAGNSHTFEWRYVKDTEIDDGSDCGWIDNIQIFQSN